MTDNSDNKGGMMQMWVVSLAISVFCCALFFAFLSTYVGSISQSLARIDERLANIEAQRLIAPPMPAAPAPAGQPPLGPFPTVIPSAPPAPVPAPAPAPAPEAAPAAAAPAPAPEAATPNLPPVPPAAAPVSPEKK